MIARPFGSETFVERVFGVESDESVELRKRDETIAHRPRVSISPQPPVERLQGVGRGEEPRDRIDDDLKPQRGQLLRREVGRRALLAPVGDMLTSKRRGPAADVPQALDLTPPRSSGGSPPRQNW
jgi:hypothetical protein